MKKTLIAFAIAALLAAGIGATANADPITCNGNTVSTKTAPGTWVCVNPAGNTANGTDETKNPND